MDQEEYNKINNIMEKMSIELVVNGGLASLNPNLRIELLKSLSSDLFKLINSISNKLTDGTAAELGKNKTRNFILKMLDEINDIKIREFNTN